MNCRNITCETINLFQFTWLVPVGMKCELDTAQFNVSTFYRIIYRPVLIAESQEMEKLLLSTEKTGKVWRRQCSTMDMNRAVW